MKLTELLKNEIIITDGATGTLLHRKGLALGKRPERLSLTAPDVLQGIHKAYFDAGSNIVCANTFGANCLNYGEDELERLVAAAMENVLRARDESLSKKPKFVALDVGSLGRLLKPLGSLGFEEAVSVFSKTVKLGAKHGADLVFIETMNDGYETKAALLAAKENCGLPVFVSNAYGENGLLMTGGSPETVIPMLEGMGADAIGVNCSFGPENLRPVIEKYLKYASVPVIMKPNAGLPHEHDGATVFDVGKDEFVKSVVGCVKSGVRVAGGCCGTDPGFIAALSKALEGVLPVEITEKRRAAVSSYCKAVDFSDLPVLIGERINPTGKKRLKQALLDGDVDYIVDEGIAEEKRGAHVLDVNVGIPEIDEKKTLPEIVSELQTAVKTPLQIDTASFTAMEAAARIYNGAPLLNSVNGKKESMDAVFTIMKKYGGCAVALTMDENGIPDTAEKRLAVAKKIAAEAERRGIAKERLIFDALTLAVSTDKNAAKTTVEAVSLIKKELGCHTVLGVSNVSFGLPKRETVNAAFFVAAAEKGLSAAIINPLSDEMMKSYRALKVLSGDDEGAASYIAFASETDGETKKESPPGEAVDLRFAVIKGLKEKAAAAARERLAVTAPMELIENELIPALDEVGRQYEDGRVFLPELLMAAEASKAAFEEVKLKMKADGVAADKGKFVIATVEGDIHDIGKNIVKLILQNYGFDVYDLGKDVPAKRIVDEVKRLHAPFAGLSALMTTTLPAMAKTVALLRKETPWCRVIVGGAVLTEEYAASIGADKYGRDAMDTVRYALAELEN